MKEKNTRIRFPWDAPVWAPTYKIARRAEVAQLMMVRVQVSPQAALDTAWEELSDEYQVEDDVLLDGGAAMCRCEDGLVEVCSGGEDILSSLSWTVNQTLYQAVQDADPEATVVVVAEAPGRCLEKLEPQDSVE